MTDCQVFVKNGLQPAPNVPNPRNAGRKKSNPVWEFFTDLRSYGLAGVRCRFCHWVTNDRSPTTMKFHLKRKHDTGIGGLWAICEEKINAQAPANYAPRVKKSDDALLKALTQPRSLNPFNPFGTVTDGKFSILYSYTRMESEVEAVPKKGRKAIAWRLIGVYQNKEEMLAARRTEKVSKRKCDELRTGTKITYRCNSWKKTRCQYQMYALHGASGMISLYEGGTHDHGMMRVPEKSCSFPPSMFPSLELCEIQHLNNALNQVFPNRIHEQGAQELGESISALMKIENAASATKEKLLCAQDELLASLLQQAQNMANSSAEIDSTMINDHDGGLSLSDSLFLNKLNENGLIQCKEEDGSSSSASGLVNACDFNLSEGITALLQIASDADLAFSFNSRSRAEYCFSSNQRAGRSVAFSDMGAEIRVAQKVGDEEIAVETWRKSDWNQFCWAVRGTCLHFLKN